MKRIVYCDIDGVLHRWPCPQGEMFDAGCIARMATVLRLHAASLVITSTWRLEWPLESIRARLGSLGVCLIGVTPEIDDPFIKRARYQEVLLHRKHCNLPGESWVAVDDEPGRYPALGNLVITDPRRGFTDDDAGKLSLLLGGL